MPSRGTCCLSTTMQGANMAADCGVELMPSICPIGFLFGVNTKGSRGFFFKPPPVSLNLDFRCQVEKNRRFRAGLPRWRWGLQGSHTAP